MRSKPYSFNDISITIGGREIQPLKSVDFKAPEEKYVLHRLIEINGNDYTFKNSRSTITVTKHEDDHYYDLFVLGEEYEMIFPNNAD